MLDHAGYGRIRDENGRAGESLYAHRVSYERAKGKIRPELDADHICRNRWCVNADHLEAVTHKVNLLRGAAPMIAIHLSETCGKGHARNEENIYWRKDRPGAWNCRACRRERRMATKNNRESVPSPS